MNVDLLPQQMEILESQVPLQLYLGARGAGKALALDTPLATTSGWTTMGEVRVGDTVFDENGKPCTVTYITEVFHGRPCYDVVFSDSAVLTTDAQHEWVANDRLSRMKQSKGRPLTPSKVTTAEMRDTLLHGKRRETNWSIDTCGALLTESADLPVDPYVLGAWLGDGTSLKTHITNGDPEVITEIRRRGYDVTYVEPAGKAATYRINELGGGQHRSPETGKFFTSPDSLIYKLRALNVSGNKHIPPMYLRASIEQRLDLLRGLLDTDGYCGTKGIIEYCSCTRELAYDAYELIMSLGYKATMKVSDAKIYGRVVGTRYRVCFTAYSDVPVFNLPRKRDNQPAAGNQSRRQRRRFITAIEPVPSVPVRCIAVDSDSHLYLAGRNMIPTHNTVCGAWWSVLRSLEQGTNAPGMIAAATYSQVMDASVRTLYEIAAANGLDLEPMAPPRSSRPMTVDIMGAPVFVRSMDSTTAVTGLTCSWLWLDEAWQVTKDAWDLVLACVRSGTSRVLITSNLCEPGEWLHLLATTAPDAQVVYSRTTDNTYLPDSVERRLREQYDTNTAKRMLDAEWVSTRGETIYFEFGRDNVAETTYNPALPLLWAHDMNAGADAPMSSVVAQLRGNVLHCIDEIVMDRSNTVEAIAEFKSRYPGTERTTIVYGDASARHKDTRGGVTDYSLLVNAGFLEQDVPKANPPIRSRHNDVNCWLRGRVIVDPRCETLIDGLTTTRFKPNTTVEKQTRSQHITTALGYMICRLTHHSELETTTGPRLWK